VFRDNVTWNKSVYTNYNIAAALGISEDAYDNKYKQRILKLNTVDNSLLHINNLISARVSHANILSKNNNTSHSRLLKLKYTRAYNEKKI
jgi:hypothetical protein